MQTEYLDTFATLLDYLMANGDHMMDLVRMGVDEGAFSEQDLVEAAKWLGEETSTDPLFEDTDFE